LSIAYLQRDATDVCPAKQACGVPCLHNGLQQLGLNKY